jgi:hypothetical protein
MRCSRGFRRRGAVEGGPTAAVDVDATDIYYVWPHILDISCILTSEKAGGGWLVRLYSFFCRCEISSRLRLHLVHIGYISTSEKAGGGWLVRLYSFFCWCEISCKLRLHLVHIGYIFTSEKAGGGWLLRLHPTFRGCERSSKVSPPLRHFSIKRAVWRLLPAPRV